MISRAGNKISSFDRLRLVTAGFKATCCRWLTELTKCHLVKSFDQELEDPIKNSIKNGSIKNNYNLH